MALKINRVHKIGFVTSLAIGLFFWGLGFLKGEKVFKGVDEFYVIFDKVDGLTVASEVVISGMKVGQVSQMYFADDTSGDVVVKLDIESKYDIRKDAMALLYSADIMGTKAIKLFPGNGPGTHATGDTLIPGIEGDLKDNVNAIVAPLKVKAENLLGSIDSLITVVGFVFNKKTQENLFNSIESIRHAFYKIESSSMVLDTLMNEERSRISDIFAHLSSITENLKNNNESLNQSFSNLESVTDSIKHANIASTIRSAKSAIDNINSISQKINQGDGSLGLLLNDTNLYSNLETASVNLNSLLEDVETNPKRYVHFSVFGKNDKKAKDEVKAEKKKKKKKRKKEKEKLDD